LTTTPASRSLEYFAHTLASLQETVQARDPEGVNLALRTALAHRLFLYHDVLRSQERPFDRAAFAACLDDAMRIVDRSEAVGPLRGVSRVSRPSYEEYVADLYSRCWAKYDDAAFTRTIDFFEERFRLNDISLAVLRGGEALDAGCGSGRYTMAMAKAGAKRAVGVDLSERAVREARQRADRLGYGSTVEFHRGSVVDLPAEWSARFDFVCSNGVVHHTPDPVKGLREIFRMLKPGGTAFVMVYGKGGLFWGLTDFIRDILEPVPVDFADAWLDLQGTPVGKIFFCLDHWYTMYQERVDQREFEQRLQSVGFEGITYMPRALIYDSSERLVRYPEEADLIGSPDLRYLMRKPG
jgi:ubiquinone/menaquinone biosynthesis C-methylase UbiE